MQVGERDRRLPADAEGIRDRSVGDEADDGGADDRDVLRQSRRPGAEHLADQQLARGGGGDQQLHDAVRLLLGDALRHPVAVGQDGHEGEDHDGVGEDEGTAEIIRVGGIVGVDRARR